MKRQSLWIALSALPLVTLALTSCTTTRTTTVTTRSYAASQPLPDYSERLPQQIASTEKVVVIDPKVHAWGAYQGGTLQRAGLATAGNSWCPDTKRPCRTSVGTFRVFSLGSPECKSSRYPLGKGGAPMPYCMYFSSNQAMHGSPANHVVEGNVSHGCVRMHVADAEWLRYNFVHVGTKVIVRPYY